MTAIDNKVRITINLNELVSIRGSFLEEQLTADDVDELASTLRYILTWDTLYEMIDSAILEYLDKPDPNRPHYGQTAGNEPAATFEKEKKEREKYFKDNFEMVDLEGGAWTIQVPRRK